MLWIAFQLIWIQLPIMKITFPLSIRGSEITVCFDHSLSSGRGPNFACVKVYFTFPTLWFRLTFWINRKFKPWIFHSIIWSTSHGAQNEHSNHTYILKHIIIILVCYYKKLHPKLFIWAMSIVCFQILSEHKEYNRVVPVFKHEVHAVQSPWSLCSASLQNGKGTWNGCRKPTKSSPWPCWQFWSGT